MTIRSNATIAQIESGLRELEIRIAAARKGLAEIQTSAAPGGLHSGSTWSEVWEAISPPAWLGEHYASVVAPASQPEMI